jgi:hypothetical protein
MEYFDTGNQMNTMSHFCNDPHCLVVLGSWGYWTFGLVADSLVLLVCSPAISKDKEYSVQGSLALCFLFVPV